MKHKHLAIAIIFNILSFVIGHTMRCDAGKKEVISDYTIDVDNDGYTILDNGKIVGRLNYGSNPSLDSLIDNDNR